MLSIYEFVVDFEIDFLKDDFQRYFCCRMQAFFYFCLILFCAIFFPVEAFVVGNYQQNLSCSTSATVHVDSIRLNPAVFNSNLYSR